MERTESHQVNSFVQIEPSQTSSQKVELKNNTRLTVDQLRKFPGVQDISEPDAIEISEALFMLAVIMYELYSQEKS